MGVEATTLAGSIAGALLGYDPFPQNDEGLPVACFISDHPYAQWWGTNGDDGLAALFLKRHIKPAIAINTSDTNAPGGSADMMTWDQCRSLQSRGIEFLAHGDWHVNDWSKINTGFTVTYSGANGTATVQWTSTQGLLVAGGADDVTITLAGLTLAEVKTQVEANGKWSMTLDTILTGAEAASLIFGMNAARSVKAGGSITYFAIGGGIRVNYIGRTYSHVYARRNSTAFTIFCDGVQKYSLTLGTNSLQTLVTAINALGAEWSASLCDNGRAPLNTKPSYVVGDELASSLNQLTYAEITSRPVTFHGGMSNFEIIDRHMQRCIDIAASNGITIAHFAQSGGGFYPWHTNHSQFGMFRGNTLRRVTAPPVMQRANLRNFLLHRALTNDATVATITIGSYDAATTYALVVGENVIASSLAAGSATLAATELKNAWNASAHSTADGITATSASAVITLSDAAGIVPTVTGGAGTMGFTNPTYQGANNLALIRALCGDGPVQKAEPWVFSPLIHKVRADGSTGLNFPTTVPSYYDAREDDTLALLDLVESRVRAGKLICFTPNDLHKSRRGRRPSNLWFNPNLENAGPEFAPLAGGDDGGFWIPGVGVTRAATQSVFSVVDGELYFNNSSATATEILYKEVELEPGKSYVVTCQLKVSAYTSGAGFQWSYQAQAGRVKGLIVPATNYKITGAQSFQTGPIEMLVTIPKFENITPCEVRGDVVEPFNLATPKYIKLNINSIGAIDDIDCSAGAGSASAVTAKEVAAAINAAIAASSSYGAEYHNAARAVGGRVWIVSPTIGTDQSSSMSISTPTHANPAVATIFGNATVDGRAQLVNPATAENFVCRFALRAAFLGAGSVSNFAIREREFN